MATAVINQDLFSDGTAQYTAGKNADGGNLVPPCSQFQGIPGWNRPWNTLPINARIFIAARWIHGQCDLLVGSMVGVGAVWVRGGLVEKEIQLTPSFNATIFNQLYSEYLAQAVGSAIGTGSASPPNLTNLSQATKIKLAELICNDQRSKDGGIC
jgi:hypothetical protein